LVVEYVAEVNPDLVLRDKNGEPLSVRYEQINAMLLNEFLKEHRKVEGLETALEAMNVRLNKRATELQQVTTQVESNSAPQLASRD
jgi:hypothetical protein